MAKHEFLSTLLGYQQEALEWCNKTEPLGGILAYDMGLGKTVISCALMVQKPMRTLILCPLGLLEQWANEIQKHTRGFSVILHYGPKRLSKKALLAMEEADIVLSTPQIMAKDLKRGIVFDASRWIVDEAHRLKNINGKAYKELYLEAPTVPCKLFLTGTPICNHVNDMVSLVCLTNREPYNSLDYWKNKHSSTKNTLLREIIGELLLRRTKEDTLMHALPPLSVRAIPLTLPAVCLQRDTYNSFLADKKILRRILRMRQAANSAIVFNKKSGASVSFEKETTDVKIVALKALLEEIPVGEKVLVFSQFTSLLISVHSVFSTESHLIYHGGLTLEQKKNVLETFKTDSVARVLFINLRAGGCGLNLVEANHVILLEPYWNEAEQKQAIDRVFRIGQTRPVIVYRMYVKYTIESWLQALQKRKRLLSQFLVESVGKSGGTTEMTPEALAQSKNDSLGIFQRMCFQPAGESSSVDLVKYLESKGVY